MNIWKEYFLYSVDNTSLAAGSGAAYTETNIKIDTDADFELIKRSHVVTDNQILVKFKDDTEGRFYQVTGLDLLSISGDHSNNSLINFFLPYILPQPIIIKAATTYTTELSDYSGSTNSIRLTLHGSKIRTGKAPWNFPVRKKVSFDYNANITVGANQTVVHNIPINIDSHFIVKKITGKRTGSALITVKDTATEKSWMNTPIHINNFLGSGQYPNNLPSPRFIYRGTNISIQVQDLSGSSNTIRINFSGEKLFE